MKIIGVMSKIADNAIDITLHNRQYMTYTLDYATLDMLEPDILYPVHFVGFSSNHIIIVYTHPEMIVPSYISTGEFKGAFMKEFIDLLGK
jgi:hypothetical protein